MSASRLKQKLAYLEQTYELESLVDSDVRYRLYRRHNPKNVQVFSVGLSVSVGGGGGTALELSGYAIQFWSALIFIPPILCQSRQNLRACLRTLAGHQLSKELFRHSEHAVLA